MVYATIQNADFSFKIKSFGDYPRTLPWQMKSTFIIVFYISLKFLKSLFYAGLRTFYFFVVSLISL